MSLLIFTTVMWDLDEHRLYWIVSTLMVTIQKGRSHPDVDGSLAQIFSHSTSVECDFHRYVTILDSQSFGWEGPGQDSSQTTGDWF